MKAAVGLALFLACGAMSLPSSSAGAQTPEPEPDSFDDLYELFDIGQLSGDFIVVVDTSGSMSMGDNPPFPDVRQAYEALVSAIPDGDRLSVVTFSGSPAIDFDGTINPTTRAQALVALPDIADGEATDIGASLDTTLRRLERADGSPAQTVIFLTDGEHAPLDGSTYATTEGPAWDELRARSDAHDINNDPVVLGIGLGERGAGGIDLLRKVFGNPEISNLPPDQLADFFVETIESSRLARLRTLVEAELESTVSFGATEPAQTELASPLQGTITLESSFDLLAVDVTIDSVDAVNGDGEPVEIKIAGPSQFRLAAGEEATVNVEINVEVDDPGFTIPPVTENERFDIAVDASYTVVGVDIIERLTPAATSGEATGSLRFDASRTYGTHVSEVVRAALIALAALALLFWLYRRFLRLPPLVGAFEVEGPVAENSRLIVLKGKTQEIDAKDVPNAGAARIMLFTRRAKVNRVYAEVERPIFARGTGRNEKIVDEDVEIRAGRYRLGGGRLKYVPKAPRK